LGRFDKGQIRAALILGTITAAAGLGRWLMDGSHSDAAHLLSALAHPLKGVHSVASLLASLLVAGVIVALCLSVWWLLLGRRRHRGISTPPQQDRDDATS